MTTSSVDLAVHTVETRCGWIALASEDGVLKRLTIGHPSARSALKYFAAVEPDFSPLLMATDEPDEWTARFVARLQAYADGAHEDFRDVPIDDRALTPFQRRVLAQCRRIPRGRTLSYAQLAARAGAPGASRAVGNVMAKNRFPLVVPCHRVVGSGGRLGGFSAPQGLTLKRRLLELEGADLG